MQSNPARRRTGLWFAMATAMISGVAVFVNGNGVRAFGDPTRYTTLKNLVAAAILGAAALVARSRKAVPPVERKHWPALLLVGVIGGGVPFVLFFEGLARASSGDAAFIHKTLVIWVAILAIPLLGERLRALHVIAIGLLVGGQAVLTGGMPSVSMSGPELMILGATLLWSCEVIVVKRLLPQIHPLTLGTARLGIGAILLVAWSVANDGISAVTASQAGWVLLTGVLLAGFVGTWYSALSRAPAVDVMSVLVGASIITAVLEQGWRGVSLVPRLDGLALIAAGVGLVWLAGRSPSRPKAGAV